MEKMGNLTDLMVSYLCCFVGSIEQDGINET